ncbi:MAG TPA: carotenoid oxygenase [Gammaproteobacteria bacterium]|nr:carotenoid oxygenase [Gammaproteobacteria bacterium]
MSEAIANDKPNPYLVGNYAPIQNETTALGLPVTGELPIELCGRYLRAGPGPINPDSPSHHWFTGDGMIHGIRLEDGKADWYRNRYVGSTNLSKFRGEPDISGPNWNDSPSGPNTNVGGFAGKTWAMVEAGGCPVELTYELETVGRNNFEGTLPGAFTAHPKIDPDTKEMHAMVYAWPHWMDHVQYVVVGSNGKVRKTVDVPVPGMTMMHDMSMTQKYIVIYDQPVTVNFDDVASGAAFPMSWNPDYGNRLGFMPREGEASDIVWVDVPLGYCFHPMNAYDCDNGDVILDLCIYDKMFDQNHLGPFGDSMARLERWTASLANRSVSTSVIDTRANEFPRHRGAMAGKPYRFGYCSSPSTDPSAGWPTIKYDLHTGNQVTFDHGAGRAAGEPVFVGKSGRSEEDAGWLVTFVHDLGKNSTEFVVMDAEDMDRGHVASIPLSQLVPFGFHGNWIPDS